MTSSCMTKLKFLAKPYMIFRLEKLSLICCLFCIEFSQALLIPYERFVILLKSRSHTHHPRMHYSYTGGRRKNIPFHLDLPKNVLLLQGESTPKIYPIGYPQINAPKILLLSLKSLLQKRSMWQCKSYS
jgi:hypothetical protein